MKISNIESIKAAIGGNAPDAKILPADRPKGLISSGTQTPKSMSPLEGGMAVAEAALADVPDVREDLVNDLKERIKKGEYNVSGQEIADMMLRRRAADKIR